MSDAALRLWQEKLDELLKAEALATDAAEKFKLKREIREAYA